MEKINPSYNTQEVSKGEPLKMNTKVVRYFPKEMLKLHFLPILVYVQSEAPDIVTGRLERQKTVSLQVGNPMHLPPWSFTK